MKENYLHLIWRSKRLPFHQMTLTNGSAFEIVDPGLYNRTESGPDFYNAKVLINGILWVGAIEIHVQASDWFKHGHQFDNAYNNVILHVVFENDCEVIQDGRIIDCLELRPFIDYEHHRLFKDSKVEQLIACENHLHTIDKVFIRSMIDRSVIDKLERKYEEIGRMNLSDEHDVLFRLMARAFGAKVNQLPFEELAIRLSKREFKLLNRSQKKRVICQVSGLNLIESEAEMHLSGLDQMAIKQSGYGSVSPLSWKYKGLRPVSFPDRRVRQFAEVISKLDFQLFMNPMDALTMKRIIQFQFGQINHSISDKKLKLSAGFIDMLIINCFVPFLFWYGRKYNIQEVCSNAIEMLAITKKEDNYIINLWKDLGVTPDSAYDSQGIIELYNAYCVKKKCLTCTIGTKILKQ